MREGGKEEKEAGMVDRKETMQLQLRKLEKNKHTYTKNCQLLNSTRIKYAKKEVTGKTLKCFQTYQAKVKIKWLHEESCFPVFAYLFSHLSLLKGLKCTL